MATVVQELEGDTNVHPHPSLERREDSRCVCACVYRGAGIMTVEGEGIQIAVYF